jgi:hypothetical protein
MPVQAIKRNPTLSIYELSKPLVGGLVSALIVSAGIVKGLHSWNPQQAVTFDFQSLQWISNLKINSMSDGVEPLQIAPVQARIAVPQPVQISSGTYGADVSAAGDVFQKVQDVIASQRMTVQDESALEMNTQSAVELLSVYQQLRFEFDSVIDLDIQPISLAQKLRWETRPDDALLVQRIEPLKPLQVESSFLDDVEVLEALPRRDFHEQPNAPQRAPEMVTNRVLEDDGIDDFNTDPERVDRSEMASPSENLEEQEAMMHLSSDEQSYSEDLEPALQIGSQGLAIKIMAEESTTEIDTGSPSSQRVISLDDLEKESPLAVNRMGNAERTAEDATAKHSSDEYSIDRSSRSMPAEEAPLNDQLATQQAAVEVAGLSQSTSEGYARLSIHDRYSPSPMDEHRLIREISAVGFVESFDWNREIVDARAWVFSEGGLATETQGRWILAEASGYRRALAWAERMDELKIPLVSENTEALLSRFVGSEQQEKAGMVLGRIPKGWEVNLSGRSEKVHYWADSSSTDNTQVFILLNAAPGAHVLTLREKGPTGKRSGVPLIVLEETSTYLDLRRYQEINLFGEVLESTSGGLQAIESAQVRLLGHSVAPTLTDRLGKFSVSSVILFSNHPLIFETDSQKGFTHRYQIPAQKILDSQTESLTLYRFSENTIYNWSDQLAGGVSADTGVLIAALPHLEHVLSQHLLYPAVHPGEKDASFIPEAYTLSATGFLEVQTALFEINPRFFSVNLPSGFVHAQLQNEMGQPYWSDMIYSSPDVISVVSP